MIPKINPQDLSSKANYELPHTVLQAWGKISILAFHCTWAFVLFDLAALVIGSCKQCQHLRYQSPTSWHPTLHPPYPIFGSHFFLFRSSVGAVVIQLLITHPHLHGQPSSHLSSLSIWQDMHITPHVGHIKHQLMHIFHPRLPIYHYPWIHMSIGNIWWKQGSMAALDGPLSRLSNDLTGPKDATKWKTTKG